MFGAIERGETSESQEQSFLGLGTPVLPPLPMHGGDRNRTSPFAFTGNKFEFRALGSSQSLSLPNTVLNTIVAEAIDELADELETAVKDAPSEEGPARDAALASALRADPPAQLRRQQANRVRRRQLLTRSGTPRRSVAGCSTCAQRRTRCRISSPTRP